MDGEAVECMVCRIICSQATNNTSARAIISAMISHCQRTRVTPMMKMTFGSESVVNLNGHCKMPRNATPWIFEAENGVGQSSTSLAGLWQQLLKLQPGKLFILDGCTCARREHAP